MRLDAQELETSLGGVYTLLAQTWQAPMAYRFLKQVGFPLSEGEVIPKIVTGLAALGRIGDLEKIQQFTEMMQLPQMWPEEIRRRTKWGIYAREVAAGLSMQLPWMMTDEEWSEYQQQQQQAQQQAQMSQAAMGAVEKAGPNIAENIMKGE